MKKHIALFALVVICSPVILLAQNVGIGTAAPLRKLDIRGGAHIESNNNATPLIISRGAGNVSGGGQQTMEVGIEDLEADFTYTNDEERGAVRFRVNNTDTETGSGADANSRNILTVYGDPLLGGVGINANFPAQELHVVGDARITGVGGTGNAVIFSQADGDLYRTDLTGSATDVLTGDGTFQALSTLSYWTRAGGNLYPSTIGDNVGIGTATPTHRLDVEGDVIINENSLYLRDSPTSKFGMGFNAFGGSELTIFSDNLITFTESDASTEVMRIQANNGRVGIGTTAPNRTLDVDGRVRIRGGGPATNYVLTSLNANGEAEWRDPNTLVDDNDWTRSGGNMYPSNIGDNIGIGTTSPGAFRLRTVGNSRFDGSTYFDLNNGSERVYMTRFGGTTEGLQVHVNDRDLYFRYVEDGGESNPGDWHFYNERDGGQSYEFMRAETNGDLVLNSTGNNVGVNEDNPDYQFDVNGFSRIGWNGHPSKISILPTDFMADNDDGDEQQAIIDDDGSSVWNLKTSDNDPECYGFYTIPNGYRATGIRTYCTESIGVKVYSAVNTNGNQGTLVANGLADTYISFTSNVNSSWDRMLVVELGMNNGTEFYGGYIEIERIP